VASVSVEEGSKARNKSCVTAGMPHTGEKSYDVTAMKGYVGMCIISPSGVCLAIVQDISIRHIHTLYILHYDKAAIVH
jgi:hypothetical protein